MKPDTLKKMIFNPDLSKEMQDNIEVFKYKFKLLYGITPYVSINTRGNYIGELSLKELFDIVNQRLDDTASKHYTDGLKSKTRLREVVLHRQMFCKVAASIGYKITSIAQFLERNHATVIHSARNITNLLQVNDGEITSCMDDLYLRIESYIVKRNDEEAF